MTKWSSGATDRPGTSRAFFHRERLRSMWIRRWDTAFEAHEAPAWSWGATNDRRDFRTGKACTAAYVAFIEQLRRDGWLQFTDAEARKEIEAQQSARAAQKSVRRRR